MPRPKANDMLQLVRSGPPIELAPRECSNGTKFPVPDQGEKNRENVMDRTTRCAKCGKRLVPVITISGRTDLQCISCDDPAVKWAESPLTAPDKPIVPERVYTTPPRWAHAYRHQARGKRSNRLRASVA